MGLTSSLYTAATGLAANGQALSVAGNNIANSNTTGYKTSRIAFETAILETINPPSPPADGLGGTNPTQIGHGVRVAGVTRKFTDGTIQPTGVNSDMALEGDGFFVIREGEKQQYTRDGSFKLDSNYNLVTNSGLYLQGYSVDEEYNVIEGVVGDLRIPLGISTLAKATETVTLGGRLNASGDLATVGSLSESEALYSDAGATTPATGATALTSLYRGDGTLVFATGDVLRVNEISRGTTTLPESSFEIGATNTTQSDDNGTTLAELMAFFENSLGINTSVGGGVTIDAAGQIQVESNAGVANQVQLDSASMTVYQSGGTTATAFAMTDTQDAVGESVTTSFPVYDSLGNELQVNMTYALESRDSNGTVWRYYLNSEDDTDLSSVLSTGTLAFGRNGELLDDSVHEFQLDRAGTGAFSPQTIRLNFTDPSDTLSSFNSESSVTALNQDGAPVGTLVDYAVQSNGVISGVFSNGLLRNLGQVVVAKFSNPIGLEEIGGSVFSETVNSGSAQVVKAGSSGAGKIIGGALEASNVELSDEFINLINASTGFSANSRVLTTSDEMLRELLSAVR